MSLTTASICMISSEVDFLTCNIMEVHKSHTSGMFDYCKWTRVT